jgi:hypothetical protein
MKSFLVNSIMATLLVGLLTSGISCSAKWPSISFNPPSLTFTATQGASNPSNQAIAIWNSGGGALSWSAICGATWLSLSPTSGSSTSGASNILVSVNVSNLSAGNYNATITLSASGATNNPQAIPVSLTVAPPPMTTVRTTWNVQWFNMPGLGQWGSQVGTSQFPATFAYDWGNGPVYDGYSDWIGFQATATINMQRPGGGSVTFTVVSDDGTRLYLDGNIILNNWPVGPFTNYTATAYLTPGKHALRLDYFENILEARVSFSCDPDVLEWQESSP